LTEDALFYAQQAVEKAMKRFLAAHDLAFRKTHDLDEPEQSAGARPEARRARFRGSGPIRTGATERTCR
jgi:hypothetical protein